MASLTYKSGRALIQWHDAQGERKSMRYGDSRRGAEQTALHIERIVAAHVSKSAVPLDTSKWLADIGNRLHAKLASKGLIQPREQRDNPASQLGPFLERYIKGRTDLKERSVANLTQVMNGLVAHFGRRQDMAVLNRGDLRDWHRGLLNQKYATATVAMHVKKARQMFQDAVDRKLITENPVVGIKAGSQSNPDRMVYVPASSIEEVIGVCPDAEWKLIFALARYGGIRIPSELLGLRWSRVHWDKGRFIVRSPKTAGHVGKAERAVPLFPELVPYLLACFEAAEPGEDRVIVLHRGENLRTTAEKLIERAGLTLWEKPFQNLRSSRETDLADVYPIHVVCKWIGNSEAVAKKHYLQVMEEHFNRASGKSAAPGAAEGAGKDRKFPEPKCENPRESEGFAESGYPQGESNEPPDFRDFLTVHAKALHRALLRLQTAVPRLRERDIRVLARAVRAAQGGAA